MMEQLRSTDGAGAGVTVLVVGATGGTTENLTVIGVENDDRIQKLIDKTLKEISECTENTLSTTHVQTIINKITSGHKWITITGNAGEGKTTLAYWCLKELQADNYNVFMLDDPADYFAVDRSKLRRCVIVMNDIFGPFAFLSSAWSRWQPVLTHLLDIKSRHRKITVIFVGRTNVLQGSKSSIGKYFKHIMAAGHTLNLSKINKSDVSVKQRLDILHFHLRRANITDIPPENINAVVRSGELTPHGFPHCCFLYTEIRKRHPDPKDFEGFFRKPYTFLKETTDVHIENAPILRLFEEMLKQNGEIRVESFAHDIRQDIQKACDEMNGSYIKSERGKYVFLHSSVYESVALCIGTKDPTFAIQHYDASYILQRVSFTFEDDLEQFEPGRLYIPASDDNIKLFCKRFLPDIMDKDFSILRNKVFHTELICEQLLQNAVCKLNNIRSIAQRLQRKNVDINAKDDDGNTLLHVATSCRNTCAIKILLKLGADVNITDQCGKTVFHKLCKDNAETDLLKLAIEHRADINRTDRKGVTPVHHLCQSHPVNINSLIVLLDHGADINKQRKQEYDDEEDSDEYNCSQPPKRRFSTIGTTIQKMSRRGSVMVEGLTVLHDLCLRRHFRIDAVEMLLKRGASVNMTDMHGRTPLHMVVMRNDSTNVILDAVKLLIRYKAACHIADRRGSLPLYYVLKKHLEPEEEFMELLTDKTNINAEIHDKTTLLHFIYEHKREKLEFVLRIGADVNMLDEHGRSVLHKQCKNGQFDISLIQIMQKYGLDVNQRANSKHLSGSSKCPSSSSDDSINKHPAGVDSGPDLHGKTALHYLCNREDNNIDSINLLLEMGASANMTNRQGMTALHMIMNTRNSDECILEVARLLIRHEASINRPDKNGDLPLHYAINYAMEPKAKFIELLTDNTNVNGVDQDGLTILHKHCKEDELHSSIINCFLKKGASVNQKDHQGLTALHYAVNNCRLTFEAVLLLVDCVDEINAVNSEGQTYIHILCKQEKVDLYILKLLINRGVNVWKRDNSGKRASDYILAGNEEAEVVLRRLEG